MKNIKPVANRIFVEAIPEEQTTKHGIVLTGEINRDKPRRGKIVSVGTGCDEALEPGKLVLFSRAAFNQVEVDEKECYFLIEEDILCVFEEERLHVIHNLENNSEIKEILTDNV